MLVARHDDDDDVCLSQKQIKKYGRDLIILVLKPTDSLDPVFLRFLRVV